MLDFLHTYFQWYSWALRLAWYRFRVPTDDRAIILMRKGKFNHLELARKQDQGTAEGDEYHYGPKNHPKKFFVAESKEDEYFDDDFFVGLQDGRLLPVPLIGDTEKPDADILSKISEGKTGVALLDRMMQPSGAPRPIRSVFKWALLIVVVALIAFLIFHFGFHDKLPHLGQVTVVPTPTPKGSSGIGPLTTP